MVFFASYTILIHLCAVFFLSNIFIQIWMIIIQYIYIFLKFLYISNGVMYKGVNMWTFFASIFACDAGGFFPWPPAPSFSFVHLLSNFGFLCVYNLSERFSSALNLYTWKYVPILKFSISILRSYTDFFHLIMFALHNCGVVEGEGSLWGIDVVGVGCADVRVFFIASIVWFSFGWLSARAPERYLHGKHGIAVRIPRMNGIKIA